MKNRLLLSLICVFLLIKFNSYSRQMVPGQPPEVTTSPGVTLFVPGNGPVIIDTQVSITDVDSEFASSAVVTISNRPNGGNEFLTLDPEVIDFATDNGLELNYNFNKGELRISGNANWDVYQQLIRQIKYNNLSVFPDISDRLIHFDILDQEGNSSMTGTKIIEVQNVTAVINDIIVPQEGDYKLGDNLQISLVFNQPVFVENGQPQLFFDLNGDEAFLDYVSGSGSNTLVFQYTVVEGDFYRGGGEDAPEVVLGKSTIQDANGEDADLTINDFPSLDGVLLDGVFPYVAQIDLPENREYGLCDEDNLVFYLQMHEEVLVTGESLVLQLLFDSGIVEAIYNPDESNDEVLVFQYKIKPGDLDLDGPTINSLVLNGSVIQDEVGNNFIDNTFTNTEIPATTGIIIDTEAPAAPVLEGINPDTGSLDNDGLSNTNEVSLLGESDPGSSIRVFINGDQVGITEADENGNWELDLSGLELEEGKYSLSATATDQNCNESEESTSYSMELDLTAPEVITQNITLTLSEQGTVALVPSQINNGTNDNVSEPETISYSINQENFNCEDKGEQEVELSAVDQAGNEASNIAVVTVINETPPSFEVNNLSIQLDEDGAATLSPEDVYSGVSSICFTQEQLEFELDQSSFGCGDLGDIPVTLTVSDSDGNSTSKEFVLTVEDKILPVINGTPENMVVNGGEADDYEVPNFLEEMEASDNCSIQEFKQVPEPGTLISGYDEPHIITFEATDASGNKTESTTSIVIKSNMLAEVTDPEMVSVEWGTPWEELVFPEETEVLLSSGESLAVPVQWEQQQFEPREAGVYQNVGILELPEGYINPQNLSPTVTIIVEEKLPPEDISLSNNNISVESEINELVGFFTTSDPMDDEHTYSFEEVGVDHQYFNISGNSLYWNTSKVLPGQDEFNLTVKSTDVEGNSITASFVIHRTKPELEEMGIPNVFSPNNDGVNDDWGVRTLSHYSGVTIMIFERSGRRLFYSTDPTDRWDGTYEGYNVPAGNYYYVIEVQETGEIKRGILVLLRQ